MTDIRTRFAPSPTGFMHVGSVRTALFAWLLARQHNGQFILRIEDTDKVREVEGSVAHIRESLDWLSLTPDESPFAGGKHGPYVQSERLAIYHHYAKQLIDKGLAYADPYTPEEIAEFRAKAQTEKRPFLYRNHRPKQPPIWDGSMPLRLKIPEIKSYTWNDAVRGKLTAGSDALDDFILIKSDGFPTYNFAHIVDDFEMKISHIFRADEFLASTPKYLTLYEALDITPPIFVTLPPILRADGQKKMGKRDGAKDLLEYRDQGILPQAMINFLASLGWNDGTEQEIFTTNELIEKFSIERIQRGGSRFDPERLIWMNGQHIRALSTDELLSQATRFWPANAALASEEQKKHILSLVQDRLKTMQDLSEITSYFFSEPEARWELITENKQLKKLDDVTMRDLLSSARDALSESAFTSEELQKTLNLLLEKTGQKPGVIFSLIRIVTTWAPFSPGLADTLAVLGKTTTIARLEKAITAI